MIAPNSDSGTTNDRVAALMQPLLRMPRPDPDYPTRFQYLYRIVNPVLSQQRRQDWCSPSATSAGLAMFQLITESSTSYESKPLVVVCEGNTTWLSVGLVVDTVGLQQPHLASEGLPNWRHAGIALFQKDIAPTALPNRATTSQWVQDLYNWSLGPVSDEQIVGLFDALENAIYSDLRGVDPALAAMDLGRLAPEFIVGIPRALFPLREQLSEWNRFVTNARIELSRRDLDVRELLQGLL
jgi:hypothetical protein